MQPKPKTQATVAPSAGQPGPTQQSVVPSSGAATTAMHVGGTSAPAISESHEGLGIPVPPAVRLTPNQQEVLATLRERGAEFTAEVTERHWRKGEPYYMDSRNAAREGLVRKFNQGNKEAIETRGKSIKDLTPQEVAAAYDKVVGGKSVYVGGGWIRHMARPDGCEPVSFRVDECRSHLEAKAQREAEMASFPHREKDLKPGDCFLSWNHGRSPVAFEYGELETRDGKQGLGITRLWDGSLFDLFRMSPDAKIRIVSREEAVACAKAYRKATS